MSDHVCIKDREFDEINKKVERMQSYFTEDHDVLIRLETKVDISSAAQAEANRIQSEATKILTDKLDILMTQPSKRFAEFKLAVIVGVTITFITVVVPFLSKLYVIWANGGLQ